MTSLLLSPKFWIALIVVAVVAGMHLRIDVLKATVAADKTIIVGLEKDKQDLTEKVAVLLATIEDMRRGLEASRTAAAEIQRIETSTSGIRQRIRRASMNPEKETPIGTFQCIVKREGGDYAKIVNDTNGVFRGRVLKGGGTAPPGGNPGAPAVLPGPAAARSGRL